MVLRGAKKSIENVYRKAYLAAYLEKIEGCSPGDTIVLRAGDEEYQVPIAHMLNDWVVVPQELVDGMGKYAHQVVKKDRANTGIREFGSSGAVALPMRLLAAVLAEFKLRSDEETVRSGLESIISSVKPLADGSLELQQGQ